MPSCGPNKEQIKEEERMRMEAIEELQQEKADKEAKEAMVGLDAFFDDEADFNDVSTVSSYN